MVGGEEGARAAGRRNEGLGARAVDASGRPPRPGFFFLSHAHAHARAPPLARARALSRARVDHLVAQGTRTRVSVLRGGASPLPTSSKKRKRAAERRTHLFNLPPLVFIVSTPRHGRLPSARPVLCHRRPGRRARLRSRPGPRGSRRGGRRRRRRAGRAGGLPALVHPKRGPGRGGRRAGGGGGGWGGGRWGEQCGGGALPRRGGPVQQPDGEERKEREGRGGGAGKRR